MEPQGLIAIRRRSQALRHFKAFCKKENLDYNVENVVCQESVFEKFGLYLYNDARNLNSKEDKSLSAGTVGEFFGHGKEFILRKYRSNKIWEGHNTAKGEGRNDGGG